MTRTRRIGREALWALTITWLWATIAPARDLPPWMPPIIDTRDLGAVGPPPDLLPLPTPESDSAAVAGSSLSVGKPNRGRLIYGVKLESGEGLKVRADDAWGTAELVAVLKAAVADVERRFPGSPPLLIGDLSAEHGGRLRPHKSHQSGRDADIGYYFKGVGTPSKFLVASERNLDLPRTWALIQAFLVDDKTEYLFIDRSVQQVLYRYVTQELDVPPAELAGIFPQASKGPRSSIIRHRRGHKNHIHIRTKSPLAVAAGELHGATAMAALNLSLPGPEGPAYHRVRKGETLAQIARKRHVRLKDLARWNRMSAKGKVKAGQRIALGPKVAKKSKKAVASAHKARKADSTHKGKKSSAKAKTKRSGKKRR